MKNKLTTIFASVASLFVAQTLVGASADAKQCQADIAKDAWSDISVLRINKEAPSAFMLTYPKFKDATRSFSLEDIENIHSSDSYKLLNGDWKFFWANDHTKDVKPEFFAKDFDDTAWDTIPVPCSWQNKGYDTIFYRNITMEFMYDKDGVMKPEFEEGKSKFGRTDFAPIVWNPYIPDGHKQAGIYRRAFTVPADWNGKEVFMKFCGVRTGFRLFVNGQFVGYSEDSFTPAEFDVTKYLKRGEENTVAVQVYKFTTGGAYCEMQDMPHMMGIIRDVVLVARPKLYVKDYFAPVMFSKDLKSAEVDFTVDIKNVSTEAFEDCVVSAWLVEQDGTIFTEKPLFKKELDKVASNDVTTIKEKVELEGFKLWSPDKPNLYTLCFKLEDKNGKELETTAADFGFRKFKIVGRHLEMNNKPMLMKGVNRHDWSPDKGKAVDFHYLLKDVELMKQANINFVRASHYPNDDRFNMLCNRIGLAVLDENNHEMHAFIKNPAMDLPMHIPPAVDRAKNMVFRDRNVPCIVIFSVGNESAMFYTKGHKAVEKVVRDFAPQHYFMSHAETYDIVNGKANGTSDFFSPMYRDITQMNRYLELENETKPFFFPEYAHGMGNSIGNLYGMWKKIRSTESLNGGFIWDWVDQSIYLPRKDGKGMYLSYGDDWGTIPTASNFCGNGIIFADRTYSAKFFEVQKVYCDIQIEQIGKNPLELRISNEFIDTDLSEFTPRVKVERNGKVIAEATFPVLDLPAGESRDVSIVLPSFDSSKAGEYFYTVEFLRNNTVPFAKRNSVAASGQFFLKKVDSPKFAATSGDVKVSEKGESVVLSVNGIEAVFDKRKAALTSYSLNGKKVIDGAVEFDIDSAWIDNHKFMRNHVKGKKLDSLKLADKSMKIESLASGAQRVICKQLLAADNGQGFEVNVAYTFTPAGELNVSTQAVKLNKTAKRTFLPRVGLRILVAKDFDNVDFFGKGPFANYIDRGSAAKVGAYSSKVADWYESFMKPQDTGNREDVRWLALTNSDKNGILVSASQRPLPMAVQAWTQAQIKNSPHTYELPEPKATELRVASFVCGIGNGSCGLRPRDEFCHFFKGSTEWNFNIIPVKANSNFAKLHNSTFVESFGFEHTNKNLSKPELIKGKTPAKPKKQSKPKKATENLQMDY